MTVWPDIYRAWARSAGVMAPTVASAMPAASTIAVKAMAAADGTAVHSPAAPPVALAIVDPLAGAVYHLDPTLRSEFQALSLRARGASAGALHWFVDDQPVGNAPTGDAVRWPLVRGEHDVTVRDDRGHAASARVVVR